MFFKNNNVYRGIKYPPYLKDILFLLPEFAGYCVIVVGAGIFLCQLESSLKMFDGLVQLFQFQQGAAQIEMTLYQSTVSLQCCLGVLDGLRPPVGLHVAEGSVGVVSRDIGVESQGFGVTFYCTVVLACIEIFISLIFQFLVTV